MLIPAWVKPVASAGVLALCAWGGWQVRDWQADAADLARLEAERVSTRLLVELAEEVATRTEVAIGAIRVENKTIHQKAVHEIQRETVYSDCRLTPDGVRHTNEARRAANAAVGAVPAAADAGR